MTSAVGPLEPDRREEAFELATGVFVSQSSVHTALGISLEDYRAYLRPSFEAMVAEGLSVQAVGAEGAMLGCLIAMDWVHEARAIPPRFAPIGAICSALANAVEPMERGEAVLVDMAAVVPEAAGQGLYREMREYGHDLARARGYRRVFGELSSATTQHVVLERMGHRTRAKVRLKTFEFEGARPFSGVTDPDALVLSEGRL